MEANGKLLYASNSDVFFNRFVAVLNHDLTFEQIEELRSLGFNHIYQVKHPVIDPSLDYNEVKQLFLDTIKDLEFDALMVMGDYRFFASALEYCRKHCIPFYVTTTSRVSVEKIKDDGSVEKTSVFKHCRFVKIVDGLPF